MSIYISAVICTINRSEYLAKAIQSLAEQTLSDEYYEILVIDNGSSDNTREMVLEKCSHISNLYYLYEPVLGLCQSRNTGFRKAKGEIVAFLDDDAVASPQWLKEISDAFKNITPSPAGVGGKVLPIWEIPQPSWLPDSKLPYFTVLDYGDKPKFLREPNFPFGTNMAFKKSVLLELDGFNTYIGRNGNLLLSNEEIYLFKRMCNKALPIFYQPNAVVKHLIPKDRLTKKWLCKRDYWQGRSDALMISGTGVMLLGIIRSLIGMIVGPVHLIITKRPKSLYEFFLIELPMSYSYRTGKLTQFLINILCKK